MNVPQSTVHDCLSLTEGGSVVIFSNTTDTAYRSNDDGMTWSRDPSIDEQTKPACSWSWPITVSAEPPITFYYMEGLGIYQSLDKGETLTLLPLALGKGAVPQAITTPSDTLIISMGDGELWLRLPNGEWLQYKEKFLKLRLEPVSK